MGQMEACFGPFGDSVNLDARLVHGFAPNMQYTRKSFWAHMMELLGDGGQMELISVCLQTVLISVQGRCTICAEYTTGIEILLATPDGPPR
jgi:hypothetical protein